MRNRQWTFVWTSYLLHNIFHCSILLLQMNQNVLAMCIRNKNTSCGGARCCEKRPEPPKPKVKRGTQYKRGCRGRDSFYPPARATAAGRIRWIIFSRWRPARCQSPWSPSLSSLMQHSHVSRIYFILKSTKFGYFLNYEFVFHSFICVLIGNLCIQKISRSKHWSIRLF